MMAIFCQLGLGSNNVVDNDGTLSFNWGGGEGAGWWDWNGTVAHKVCDENLTAVGESGLFLAGGYTVGLSVTGSPAWQNTTGFYDVYPNNQGIESGAVSGFFVLGGYAGFLGIIVALVFIGIMVGVRVFGIGLSDNTVDMVFKTTGYLGLWGLFSVLAMGAITGIPTVGVVFYGFLSFIFCLGVINSVGHPSGGD